MYRFAAFTAGGEKFQTLRATALHIVQNVYAIVAADYRDQVWSVSQLVKHTIRKVNEQICGRWGPKLLTYAFLLLPQKCSTISAFWVYVLPVLFRYLFSSVLSWLVLFCPYIRSVCLFPLCWIICFCTLFTWFCPPCFLWFSERSCWSLQSLVSRLFHELYIIHSWYILS